MIPFRKVNLYELFFNHHLHEGEILINQEEMWAVWSYDSKAPNGTKIYDIVYEFKCAGYASWTGKVWMFTDRQAFEEFLTKCRAHGVLVKSECGNGHEFSSLPIKVSPVSEGWLLITTPKPPANTVVRDIIAGLPFFAESADRSSYAAILSTNEFDAIIKQSSLNLGAIDIDLTSKEAKTPPPTVTPVRVPAGFLVLDLRRHPLALRILIEAEQLPKPVTPWKTPPLHEGIICVDDKGWEELAMRLRKLGIPIGNVLELDGLRLEAGWDKPGRCGETLHGYQKAGIEFLAQRSLRAILADEMGLGKTVQAIRAAVGTGMKRILVIAPAIARWVWDAEIRRWCECQDGEIYHLNDTVDVQIPPEVKWVIATYDQTVPKENTLKLPVSIETFYAAVTGEYPSQGEDDAFQKLLRMKEVSGLEVNGNTITLKLKSPLCLTQPELLPLEAQKHLERANKRLGGSVIKGIMDWLPDLVILDEAHRVKNPNAKRTQTICKLLDLIPNRRVIILTGTPVRNHGGEARQLITLIDPFYGKKAKNDSLLRASLAFVMLRRKKQDVMEQLPSIIRQTVEIDIEAEKLEEYYDIMEKVLEDYEEAYARAKSLGCSDAQAKAQARRCVLALLSRARRILGVAKAEDLRLAEMIADSVETQKVAIFCHHHDAIAALRQNLSAAGLRVVVVSGEMDQCTRIETVESFNRGDADIFIGSISIMESISLSDIGAYFLVEFPWVPAEILQAEARLIRPAQDLTAQQSIHAVKIVAKILEPNLDKYIQEVLDQKLATIGYILNDDTLPTAFESVANLAIDWVLKEAESRKKA
ncbi:MAG: DEAD/DEAH box helicase [Thermanaeromonas sp.]|uniref:SNF2-related protein n=1 Tax=Thermanaeromonas sp. TaxID=2003697 RepID=UPI00243D1762|nr:DEAD/DEAH box helicase [Thermanaeromonas sp.]MCG0277947.1 DEAD/DEAH box helicase [Thermanaeromonas sp.]